mgnify:CR=1 FL=1
MPEEDLATVPEAEAPPPAPTEKGGAEVPVVEE